MLGIVIGSAGMLVFFAVLVGLALDRESRQNAWRRVAEARRRNGEQLRVLDERRTAAEALADELDGRERRLDLREHRLTAREAALEAYERDIQDPGARPA